MRTGRPRGRGVAAGLAVVVVLLVAACGSTAPTSSNPATPGPTVDGSGGPKPTIWPTTVVEASIALGAADGDFSKLADDVVKAVDSEDPATMLGVMNDALTFLNGNQKNIPHLQAYPETKPVGDKLAVAYAQMIEGATKARDGLIAADGAAVQAGFQEFFAGNAAYVAVAPALGDLAGQAIFMKRQLLR